MAVAERTLAMSVRQEGVRLESGESALSVNADTNNVCIVISSQLLNSGNQSYPKQD
jgi:hypothetical protein